MRRVGEHLEAEHMQGSLRKRTVEGRALRTRATLIYRPDLNQACRDNRKLRAHRTALRNVCVSPRDFSVDSDRDDSDDYVDTVVGHCRAEWFCVTTLKDSMHIVEPDNLQLGQAASPICTKQFEFDTYAISSSLFEFVSDWFAAPRGRFKVFLGRMAVLGDTSGLDYKMIWRGKEGERSIFKDAAGIKSILPANKGSDHEYDLSYVTVHGVRTS
ncbi:hypothetical protein L13192_02689 [Pyrenophora tritici-repentis]|nr:hypothetical protein L13192_02689 [Pyrenophora tritici-repentis]